MALPLATGNLENQAALQLEIRGQCLKLVVGLNTFHRQPARIEIAEVTRMSVPTVKRDWARARAWLFRAMQPDDAPRALTPPGT